MKCPCEDCLLVPACRNKFYGKLHETCPELQNFLAFHTNLHKERVQILERTLKPNKWRLGKENETLFTVIY